MQDRVFSLHVYSPPRWSFIVRASSRCFNTKASDGESNFKESAMPILRLRVTGNRDAADAIMATLNSVDELERVEEVDDEMPTLRDDSTSLELPDDLGASVYRIEIETPHRKTIDRVHDIIEMTSRNLDAAVEFVDRF
jgi:hypothetical protein